MCHAPICHDEGTQKAFSVQQAAALLLQTVRCPWEAKRLKQIVGNNSPALNLNGIGHSQEALATTKIHLPSPHISTYPGRSIGGE